MKWMEPHDGQTRMRRQFLWRPLTIQNVTRWLEMATWTERYNAYSDCWWGVCWEDVGYPWSKRIAAEEADEKSDRSAENVRPLAPADNQTPTQNGHS